MSALREYLKEQETQRPLTKIEQLIMLTAEMSGFLPEEAYAELERLQAVEQAAREVSDEMGKPEIWDDNELIPIPASLVKQLTAALDALEKAGEK